MPPAIAPDAGPLELVLYEDPLSPWCALAEHRIAEAAAELGLAFTLRHAPYPLHAGPRLPTRRERRRHARAAERARRAGLEVSPDLWLSPDPPCSSLPALAALSAARRQGREREVRFRRALREAAHARGLNVSRADVLVELAELAGLDLDRFTADVRSPATVRDVLDTWRTARGRGIDGAPALVIGEEWLVSGPRSKDEYASILRRYVERGDPRLTPALPPQRTFH